MDALDQIGDTVIQAVASYFGESHNRGIVDEAQTAAAVLGHNFPDSQWYKHAYTLVKSSGVEPKENQGSWISKAFKGIVG